MTQVQSVAASLETNDEREPNREPHYARAVAVCRSPAMTAATEFGSEHSLDRDFRGVWCAELELSGGGRLSWMSPPEPQHGSARILVRLHGEPLGYLREPSPPMGLDAMDIDAGEIDAGALGSRARAEFADRIDDHLALEGIHPGARDGADLPVSTTSCPNRVTADELVSVVVCTRDRSHVLSPCLDRLAALTYPRLEILVVDNAPTDDSTRLLVQARADQDARFRYVQEPRPGLSAARNRGIREANGTYVAYTDDDVAVDAGWVEGLLRGFRSAENVDCVTGLVCTAGIASPAEAYFDARSPSWSSRFDAELFDLADHRGDSSVYPYSAGIYGTGANFAFRRAVFAQVGSFDEALGAGTPTRGGEDLDMFVRILLSGGTIAYQPAAIVWHHHRADDDALLTQLFGYGTGFSAYLTKIIAQRSTRWDVLRRIPIGVIRMASIQKDTQDRLTAGAAPPKRAWTRELAGYAAGPWLYLRAHRAAARP